MERTDGVLRGGTATRPASISRGSLWAGWVASILPVALLLFSAGMKLAANPAGVQGMTHLGWPEHLAFRLGTLEAGVTVLYLVPPTSVLGAILATGYLGGATATHVRIGEPWLMPVLAGVLIWVGLFLREPGLRSLVPLRRRR